jgi:hypothetical protein
VATEEELELDDDDTEGPDRILCEGQLDVLGLFYPYFLFMTIVLRTGSTGV